jgi:hypothetical protein
LSFIKIHQNGIEKPLDWRVGEKNKKGSIYASNYQLTRVIVTVILLANVQLE